MESNLFMSVASAIIVATLISCVMRFLKQPLIIGYILTGILVGPQALGLIGSDASVGALSQLGVALLLFLVGIGLDPKVIKEVGNVAVVSGIGQVLVTALLGFGLSMLVGFTTVESIYVAIAFTLSSTIIVMKLLSDKNELETLHGKIAMGILIIQDLVALVALLVVSSLKEGGSIGARILETAGAGILIVAILIVFSIYVLPRLLTFVASTQELLFLFSIGWVFLVAILFGLAKFSVEIGALLAGVALSMSPYKYEMSAKVKPLRDFFILIFFILLGSQISFSDVRGHIPAVIAFTIFILILDPLIVIVILNRLGYTMRTAFLTGLTMAQVSEFSFILMGLGAAIGHVRPEITSVVTTVGLITIACSAYMIPNGSKLYQAVSPSLRLLERSKKPDDPEVHTKMQAQVLLFGHNRIGHDLLNAIRAIKKTVLVVDYNPEVITQMERQGIACIYGDANDHELLEQLDVEHIKMVVSTIPSEETNRLLVQSIRRRNKDAIFIGVSHQIDEALRLYKSGASYVLLPHFLGGTFAADMIRKHGFAKQKFHKEKQGHLKSLIIRKKLGHEHPRITRH